MDSIKLHIIKWSEVAGVVKSTLENSIKNSEIMHMATGITDEKHIVDSVVGLYIQELDNLGIKPQDIAATIAILGTAGAVVRSQVCMNCDKKCNPIAKIQSIGILQEIACSEYYDAVRKYLDSEKVDNLSELN